MKVKRTEPDKCSVVTPNGTANDVARENCSLSRDDIDSRCVGQFKTAKGTRPDLKLIDLGGRHAVLKDYRHSDPLFGNIIAPILIRRERGALLKLQRVEGAPALLGSIDRHALLMEHVEGTTLRDVSGDVLGSAFFAQLEDLIRRIHAAGVAHCDLRLAEHNGGQGRTALHHRFRFVRLPRQRPEPCHEVAVSAVLAGRSVRRAAGKRKMSPSLLTLKMRRLWRGLYHLRGRLYSSKVCQASGAETADAKAGLSGGRRARCENPLPRDC